MSRINTSNPHSFNRLPTCYDPDLSFTTPRESRAPGPGSKSLPEALFIAGPQDAFLAEAEVGDDDPGGAGGTGAARGRPRERHLLVPGPAVVVVGVDAREAHVAVPRGLAWLARRVGQLFQRHEDAAARRVVDAGLVNRRQRRVRRLGYELHRRRGDRDAAERGMPFGRDDRSDVVGGHGIDGIGRIRSGADLVVPQLLRFLIHIQPSEKCVSLARLFPFHWLRREFLY